MGFRHLLWLFPVALTLHNAEEALWLPYWSKRSALWRRPVSPGVFRFAAAVLTMLAYLLAGLTATAGKQSLWAYLLFGSMVVAFANIFLPHLALSLVLRSYMPGLATGLAVNLPVLFVLIGMAFREGYVSGEKAIAASLGTAVLLLVVVWLLFKIGKMLKL